MQYLLVQQPDITFLLLVWHFLFVHMRSFLFSTTCYTEPAFIQISNSCQCPGWVSSLGCCNPQDLHIIHVYEVWIWVNTQTHFFACNIKWKQSLWWNVLYEKYRARGVCWETNTAQGETECCICLETPPSAR